MNAKRIICLVLAILMGITVLVGCGLATSSSTSGSGSGSSSAAQAAYDYSAGLTEEGHFEGIEAGDYLTLPAYKGVEIPAEQSVAKEEDIKTQLDTIAGNYTTTEQIKDRAVKDGDSLNISYVGKVDGEAFEGGSTGENGTTVTIGVTQYIDDFLEQLIGHKPGETFDIEVTFPEDYGKENLNGKDAVFTITINYIENKVVPTVDDAFVAANLKEKYGFETLQQLRDDISASIVSQQEASYLWNHLHDITEFKEIPEQIITFQKNLFVQNNTSAAAQYGMDLATYVSLMGYEDEKAMLEANQEYIENAAKELLMTLAIAKAENIKVEDKDIAEFLGTEDFSAYTDYYGAPFVTLSVLQQKVNTFIMENAVRA